MATRSIERDEDLALFHEMQRRDRERRNTAMQPASDNSTIEAHSARFPSLFKMASSGISANACRVRTAGEELLASDVGKNDYDWLLTPPGTPLVIGSENDPMADMALISAQKSLPNLVRSLAAVKTTRLSRDSLAKLDSAIRTGGRSNATNIPTNRRSSLAPTNSTPSSRPASRSSTPTSRPTISSSSSTAASSNRSVSGLSSARAGVSSRSTTPLRRPSTPVLSHSQSQPIASVGVRSSSASRVSSLPSRGTPSSSRGSSPTMRTRAWQPSAMPGFSLEPPPNLRTSVPSRSVSNTRGVGSSSRQTAAPVQGVTSSGSSRPGMSSSSSSSIASSNFSRPGALSSPRRPARPGSSLLSTGSSRPTSSSSSAVNPSSMSMVSTSSPSSTTSSRAADVPPDRSRRQSCSPSVARGRTPMAERSVSRSSRGDGSPRRDSVGRGSKIGDRMIQSRRTATLSLSPERIPASQARRAVTTRPLTPMVAKETAGYGKVMSRKSIDMALRHMEMRQSASNGLRPLVSNMPSSSFYTVRSASVRGGGSMRPGYSPRTTSSTASSDHSMSLVRDFEGSELEDIGSEVGSRASPRSAQDSMLSVAKEERVTKWVDSGDFARESNVELLQKFRKGIEKVGGGDAISPSVCCQHLHGGVGSGPCELCSLKSRLQSLKASPTISATESMNMSSYSASSNDVPSPASSHL